MEESPEVPYDPAAAAPSSTPSGVAGSGGRGRGRGRGRGGGGIAIEGIAELDASLGRPPAAGRGGGAGPPPPAGGGGKPLPNKKEGKDFRGPEGLFKKADWTCTACGNVNWERRQTCNKCQNQKPNVVTTDEVERLAVLLLLFDQIKLITREYSRASVAINITRILVVVLYIDAARLAAAAAAAPVLVLVGSTWYVLVVLYIPPEH